MSVSEKDPTAILYMADGAGIAIRLLPQNAPNTVASFTWAASHGWFDDYAIQRIVPGNWVDISYSAFNREECKYLLPNEFTLHPDLTPLPSFPGCVCMGGYGEAGLAGCEFFFPLRECPEHKGVYPVFGHITDGLEHILRIGQTETIRVFPKGCDGVEVYEPVSPQIIRHVEVILHGYSLHEPVKMPAGNLPACWT